jgi:hypothetical protein
MRLWKTWKKVMFDPMNFYEEMPDSMSYTKPSIFYMKMYALTLAVIYLFAALFGSFFVAMAGLSGNLGLTAGITGIIIAVAIVMFPVLVLLSWGMLYVGAGATHIFVVLFGGKKGYKETYKSFAYSVAPAIFSFIPFIGYAASFYMIALQVIGIHKRQNLSIGKSIAVVLIPVAVFFIFLLIVYFGLILSSVAFRGFQ